MYGGGRVHGRAGQYGPVKGGEIEGWYGKIRKLGWREERVRGRHVEGGGR